MPLRKWWDRLNVPVLYLSGRQVIDGNALARRFFDLHEMPCPLDRLVAPEAHKEFQRLLRDLGEAPALRPFTRLKLRRADGNEEAWDGWLLSLHDEDGSALTGMFLFHSQTDAVAPIPELSGEHFRLIVERTQDAVYVIDPATRRFVFVNPKFCEIFECKPEELTRLDFMELVAPESIPLIQDRAQRRARGESVPSRYEFKARTRSGRILEVEVNLSDIHWDGTPAVLGVLRDVTERNQLLRNLQTQERRIRYIVDHMPGMVWTVNKELRITSAMGSAFEHLGLQPGDLVGKPLQQFLSADDPGLDPINAHQDAFQGKSTAFEMIIGNRTFRVTVDPLSYVEEEITGAIGFALDVTDIKKFEERLSYQATHDPLTGLWNQNHFNQLIQQEIHRYHRYGHPAALLFIDLDRFKEINDAYGHTMGNRFLELIGEFLQRQLRDADILARYGGDEFVVLMTETGRDEAEHVAYRLLENLNNTVFEVDGKTFNLSASIGIATLEPDYHEPDGLIQSANMAMYWAKEQGGNQVVVFDTEAEHHLEGRSIPEWRTLLYNAIRDHSFLPYYQPIIDCRSNQIVGAEVLLRLESRDGQHIEAQKFLPLASRFGIVFDIDRWVLENIHKWHEALLSRQKVDFFSFNLSARSLRNADFIPLVDELFPPDLSVQPVLGVEVSEIMGGREPVRIQRALLYLKSRGFGLLLDDFGSGPIDIPVLKTLPLDFIKIDGRYIQRIARDPKDLTFVRIFQTLAKELGIRTIAEWVESQEIYEIVRELGIDHAQGYALAAPEPIPLADV